MLGRLSFVSGKLRNSVLLVLSFKNSRFRRPFKSGLLNLPPRELDDFADFSRIFVLMCFLNDALA